MFSLLSLDDKKRLVEAGAELARNAVDKLDDVRHHLYTLVDELEDSVMASVNGEKDMPEPKDKAWDGKAESLTQDIVIHMVRDIINHRESPVGTIPGGQTAWRNTLDHLLHFDATPNERGALHRVWMGLPDEFKTVNRKFNTPGA